MPWSVQTQGTRQLTELQARIKQAGDGGIRRKFRRNVRDAGRPVVAAIRAAAMGVRVTTLGTVSRRRQAAPTSIGLRARVARSVGISQTRKGIRIRVSAPKFGPYGVTLPRYLDADLPRYKRWRHPVFFAGAMSEAPPSRVVQQQGQPYFFVTIRRHRAGFEKAVVDAMNETARELSR